MITKIFLALLWSCAVQSQATVIIDENFDVADVPALLTKGWGQKYDPSVVSIVASPTHSGSGALRLTYAPGQDGLNSEPYNGGVYQYFAGQDEIYERWYMRFDPYTPGQPSAFTNDQGVSSMKIHYFNDAGAAPTSNVVGFFNLNTAADSIGIGSQHPAFLVDCPSGSLQQPTCTYFPNEIPHISMGIGDGHWYCVETHQKMNNPTASDGVLEVWIDGSPTMQYTGLKMRDPSTASAQFLKVFIYRQSALNLIRYEDDYVLATTRVGCMGATPTDTMPPAAPKGLSVL